MVENPGFRAAHHQGFYGMVGPSGDALYGLLFDPGAGLFPLTPLLCAAPFGLALLLRNRARRAEGVCALLVVSLTTLAITSMNNWRGGWTIGPRYLALCVPFLAWTALLALEQVAARAPVLALSLALGATVAAFVASGLPSAYYPHLPPELTRPLPQLFAVLIAHDYAPPNAGAWLGWYGTPSMLPLLLAALCALALCVRAAADLRTRAVLLALGLLAGACLDAPLWSRPAQEPGALAAVAFVTRHFSPQGHDRAARLAGELRGARTLRDDDLRRVAALYAEEGRMQEARRALHGKL
jgi:hypothetical protein